MSNCVNSGIRRIGVVTQYKSHSLLRHLQRGWSFLRGEVNEFVDLMPAQQRIDEESWYRGAPPMRSIKMSISSQPTIPGLSTFDSGRGSHL